jgi:hypothetical protein
MQGPETNGQKPPLEVVTCFIVVVHHDGGSQVILDQEQTFNAVRGATPKDVFPALSNILADWQGMKTAEAVVAMQTQLARQAADQAAAEQIRRNLEQQKRGRG